MKKTIIGITVVGRDKEGIVAAFTNFVFSKGGNIEQINQNVLKGLFGMYLEASFGDPDVKIDSEIQDLAAQMDMDVSVYHKTDLQKKIAVFVTKEPLCLKAILENSSSLHGDVSVVVGTQDTLKPVAEGAGIPFVLVDAKEQREAEETILRVCKEHEIDLIVLARYMRILTPNFVWRYPNRIINIHPSLLPAFPGSLAYEQAFERGTKIVGVTSHYVTESLDQGPIILQESFYVEPDATLEEIKAQGQKLESQTLLKAVQMHLDGRLAVHWRKVHTR